MAQLGQIIARHGIDQLLVEQFFNLQGRDGAMTGEDEEPFIQSEQAILYASEEQCLLQNPGSFTYPSRMQYISGEQGISNLVHEGINGVSGNLDSLDGDPAEIHDGAVLHLDDRDIIDSR